MKRLYVGNLPYATTKEELEGHFSQHGKVTEVKIINDQETGRSKGFAFVEFESEADAEAALTEDGQEFGGRPLRVNEAKQKEQREGRPGSREGRGGRGHARE